MISCKIIVSSNSDLTSKDFAKITFFCEFLLHIANPLQSLGTNDCSGHSAFTIFSWFPPTSSSHPLKHDSANRRDNLKHDVLTVIL